MSMTRTRIRVGLALCALIGLSAQAAEPSGPLKGQSYVAPSILFMGEDDENGLNSYVAPQIGLGQQITDRYALEFLYGGGDTEVDSGSTDVDARFFRLDALYTLGGEYWKPYAVGGVGRYRLDPESGAAFNSTRDTQLNLGLGLMRSITDRLAVRGDARNYYNLDTNESQPGLAVGLRYVLGGPTGPRDSDEIRCFRSDGSLPGHGTRNPGRHERLPAGFGQ
ncbi:MAG: outer membrane beta-barrel protein [Gammaproteobacteria bacterium]|nr:outer membrane beta-barrel protein [Gammaproteobacteria bacterium]